MKYCHTSVTRYYSYHFNWRNIILVSFSILTDTILFLIQVMTAHCGSLLLDPVSLAMVYSELMLLELLFSNPQNNNMVAPELVHAQPLTWSWAYIECGPQMPVAIGQWQVRLSPGLVLGMGCFILGRAAQQKMQRCPVWAEASSAAGCLVVPLGCNWSSSTDH